MYIALTGTCQQGAGGTPLSISVTCLTDPLVFEGVLGVDFPLTSNAGEVHFQATASGGDGSYSYAWTLSEAGDDNNIATGNVRIASGGTPTGRDYDDITFTGNAVGMSGGDPPIETMYQFTCTVTDGTGATASANDRTQVIVVFE